MESTDFSIISRIIEGDRCHRGQFIPRGLARGKDKRENRGLSAWVSPA